MYYRETAANGVYRMTLYDLFCFASVPVFIFGGAARKVAGINYQNPITESCHKLCKSLSENLSVHCLSLNKKSSVCYLTCKAKS